MGRGKVYLVGAGPGDPGLLTLRGREVLGLAEVVVYDALISQRLLDYAPPAAERIYVGKRAAAHTLSQDGINHLLIERAQAGKTVVRLKGGDPYVFGRGGEEALALVEAGLEFEVVPGVTAAVACAAYAGIPVTHREVASAVGLVTGHEADDKPDSALDWAALARWKGTLVFYMGATNLGVISTNLTAHGRAAETPVAVIHWGTTPRQKVVTGTLRTIVGVVAAAALKPPALILVGEVVALRERLNWFEKRPLFGRRIVVTRSRAQASELAARLEALGAETIEAPAIRIEPPEDARPLRDAARRTAEFDWIIFTSVNGVDAFFTALAEDGLDTRALAGRRIAAIGPATAGRLTQHGIRADLQPEAFTGAEVAKALAAQGSLVGVRILLPRADIAPKELVETLAGKGAIARGVVAYRTVPDLSNRDALRERLAQGEIDWLTFTSSSTVRNFLEAVGVEAVRAARPKIASIGPTTSATLREAGLAPTIEAEAHTIPGLIDAIVQHEKA